ncbi:hypothetical protein QA648_27395 (plasmid) [Rhizobium sp. CB3171]|uniref:hypothetical protein n=1 Tax=Rhizobium sp. CB3171 TaxID=3039157 RepID=UPI0024B1E5B1|nr:hypothetical protein [Rhizobium sp. CB3171]WFU04510.1 hypothetical protein QA648_27395 [Rhizobium sp. CB3171]
MAEVIPFPFGTVTLYLVRFPNGDFWPTAFFTLEQASGWAAVVEENWEINSTEYVAVYPGKAPCPPGYLILVLCRGKQILGFLVMSPRGLLPVLQANLPLALSAADEDFNKGLAPSSELPGMEPF